MRTRRDKMAIGFVAYNPGSNFFERLNLVDKMGFVCYLFDNSPEQAHTRFTCQSLTNVVYTTSGKNVGLAVALSVINATAFYHSYESLLFFDQDTKFTGDTLEHINNFALNGLGSTLSCYAAVVFDAKKTDSPETFGIQHVDLAISSGSLFLLDNLQKIGWHNEKYFVDGVDYEMCLRARKNGLYIGLCQDTPGFDHQSEQPDQVLSIFGRKMPLRRYSLTRVLDSLGAYRRLVVYAVLNRDYYITLRVLRSFGIFSLGQILAVVLLKKVRSHEKV